MQSMWSGSISFGLVSVPVKMYVATKSHDTSFHQVHKEDLGRVRYIKRCEICGRELRSTDIERAIEDQGTVVIVDQSDLDGLPAGAGNEIGIAAFVKADEIDPIYLERTYYLEPDDKGRKAYALLSQTLSDTDRVALGTVHLRNRTHMVALSAADDLIRLQLLHWPDEIRAPHFAFRTEAPTVSSQELDMARTLVSTLEASFEPENYVDTYEQRLQSLIEEQRPTAGQAPEPSVGGEVIDLLAALQRSVEAAPEEHKGSGTGQRRGRASTVAAKAKPKKQVAKSANGKAPAAKRAGTKAPTAKKSATRTSADRARKAG